MCRNGLVPKPQGIVTGRPCRNLVTKVRVGDDNGLEKITRPEDATKADFCQQNAHQRREHDRHRGAAPSGKATAGSSPDLDLLGKAFQRGSATMCPNSRMLLSPIRNHGRFAATTGNIGFMRNETMWKS